MSETETVIFGKTGEERVVVRLCRSCHWMKNGRNAPPIVSAAGVAHEQHEDHNDRTACGKDATGDDWWWRL